MKSERRQGGKYGLWIQVGSVVIPLVVAGVVFYTSINVQLAVIGSEQKKMVQAIGELKDTIRRAGLERMGERQNGLEKRMDKLERKVFKLRI